MASVCNPNRAPLEHFDSSLYIAYVGSELSSVYTPAGLIDGGRSKDMSASFTVQAFAAATLPPLKVAASAVQQPMAVAVWRCTRCWSSSPPHQEKPNQALSRLAEEATTVATRRSPRWRGRGTSRRARTARCKICMQTFICTTSEAKCKEHAEAKHPKKGFV